MRTSRVGTPSIPGGRPPCSTRQSEGGGGANRLWARRLPDLTGTSLYLDRSAPGTSATKSGWGAGLSAQARDLRPTSAKFAPDLRLGSAWAWTYGLAHLAGASIPLTLIGICRSMWYTFIGLRMFLQSRAQIAKNASIPIRQTNLEKS